MIGKPEWFCARKFGWGLGVKTKEGWAYIAIAALAAIGATMLPLDANAKIAAAGAVVAILVLDVLTIMPKVYSKLDEREQRHQLVAERSASFVAVAGIIGYALYLSATLPKSAMEQQLLPLIGIAVAMAMAKGATLMYMEQKH